MQGMEWTGNSRWMPITIGLVGSTFHMRALGPTLRLTSPFVVGQHPADMPGLQVRASTCVSCERKPQLVCFGNAAITTPYAHPARRGMQC